MSKFKLTEFTLRTSGLKIADTTKSLPRRAATAVLRPPQRAPPPPSPPKPTGTVTLAARLPLRVGFRDYWHAISHVGRLTVIAA